MFPYKILFALIIKHLLLNILIMKKIGIASLFVLLFSVLLVLSTEAYAQQERYSNPSWAPEYSGARYYYLPDIETYYDLSNQEFVYLDDGQWLFSNTLPPIYSGYDLFSGFVIALDLNVFQPWMHHHYYVSNYPRYYYRNFYHNTDIANIRGFSENARKPFYWKQEDRNRVNEMRVKNAPEKRHESTRPPQKANYYGRNIGRPVKVHSQMRQKRQGNQRR